jgi:hypothetical protein
MGFSATIATIIVAGFAFKSKDLVSVPADNWVGTNNPENIKPM